MKWMGLSPRPRRVFVVSDEHSAWFLDDAICLGCRITHAFPLANGKVLFVTDGIFPRPAVGSGYDPEAGRYVPGMLRPWPEDNEVQYFTAPEPQ